MTAYAELLAKGAREIRHHNERAGLNSVWTEKIAVRMEAASALATDAAQKREIKAILRMLVDSGPFDESVSPSFSAAADAMQRAARRR